MGWASAAMAVDDVRFTVTIPLAGQSACNVRVNDGMDLVLDRVLLQSERHQVSLKGTRYLVRATPSKDVVRFQFRSSAVIAALQRRGLHPIVQQPQLMLQLSMHDVIGMPMPQTVALLRNESDAIATRWGIRLDWAGLDETGAMVVRLDWRWVDDRWLALTVDAEDASLVALGGENPVDTEQPMVQLRDRLYRILLRARDVAAAKLLMKGDAPSLPTVVADEHTMIISMMRPALLSEQVGLEQVLQAVPQVKSLTPLVLSRQWQRYQLWVTDDHWVVAWFANRGMHASLTDSGWEVR